MQSATCSTKVAGILISLLQWMEIYMSQLCSRLTNLGVHLDSKVALLARKLDLSSSLEDD